MKMQTQYQRRVSIGVTVLVMLLVVGVPTMGSAGERPLSDFLSRQQAWCLVATRKGIDCARSGYGSTACKNGFTLTFPQSWTDPKSGDSAFVDSLGQLDIFGFGTIVDGSVSESRLPDGRAEVKVVIHTSDALIRAINAFGEPIFGYAFGEVAAGAEPTLGEVLLQVTFKNTAPGAPLPDFNQMVICPEPGQELEVLSIRAQADGPLREAFGVPDGTPGRIEVTQTGLIGVSSLVNPNSRVALDAYPAEKIIIRQTGQ